MHYSVQRITSAAELHQWIADRGTSIAELFDGQRGPGRTSRAEVREGAPGQKILVLFKPTPGVPADMQLDRWLDLADLATWCAPETGPTGPKPAKVYTFGGVSINIPALKTLNFPSFRLDINGPSIMLGGSGVALQADCRRNVTSRTEITGTASVFTHADGVVQAVTSWTFTDIRGGIGQHNNSCTFRPNDFSRQHLDIYPAYVTYRRRSDGQLKEALEGIRFRIFIPYVAVSRP